MSEVQVRQSKEWRPSASHQALKARAKLYADIRAFFAQRSVLEVETPVLSVHATTDVHIQSLKTTQGYLHTSPEFAMKRLLAAGSGCIYQMCKAFRHEESGRWHNTEFSMLEWYRVGFDHFQLMQEVDVLMQTVLGCSAADTTTYQHLFLQYVGIDPLLREASKLREWVVEHELLASAPDDFDYDTLLQLVFSHAIEPLLGLDRPILVYGFPASQSALAKINQDDPRIADRFELYFKGVELANGFNELTDGDEQARRFKQDNRQREQLGLPVMPEDENLIAALNAGLPDSAGVALGLDRLLMLKLEAEHIHQVIAFPDGSA